MSVKPKVSKIGYPHTLIPPIDPASHG